MSRQLRHLGCQVLTAVNGREALDIFRTHCVEIDCVILDLMMPEMGGEETFRALRAVRKDARGILSSGFAEEDATSSRVASELAGFLQKPYTLEQLRQALDQARQG